MIREWWQSKKAALQRRTLEDMKVVESLSGSGKPNLLEQKQVDGYWQRMFSDFYDRLTNDPNFFGGVNNTSRRKTGGDFPFFNSEQELGVLRESARMLCGMNPHAKGLLKGLLGFSIGLGASVRVQPKKNVPEQRADEAEKLQEAAQAHVDCTQTRNRWVARHQEFFTRSRRDGEAYFRLFHHEDGQTDIRFVWPEQIRQPPNSTSEQYGYGVQTDPDDAEKILEYSVYPVDDEQTPDYVPADEMISVLCNVDTGVRRGIPDFCWGVADLLSAANGLEMAMGEGSRLQASIAYIRQHTNATTSQIQSFVAADPTTTRKTDPFTGKDKYVKNYEPGLIVDTNDKTTFVGSPYNAGIAGHLEVSKLMVRSACVAWNAPEWLGSADASNNNFASSLVAESPFVKQIKLMQQVYCEAFKCLFERVLHHAVEKGLLPLEVMDLLEVVVTLPDPESRNGLADAQQASIEIPLGVDSRQQYADRHGRDYDRIEKDNEAYLEATGGMGNPLPLPGMPT
jgi:hypothetical protein